MGLFNRTPKCLREHPTEWYYSKEGEKWYNHISYTRHIYPLDEKLYFTNFIKSLPNIQELLKNGIRLRTSAFGKIMEWLNHQVLIDKYGNETAPKWKGYENILDRDKNPFLNFLMKLNHDLTNSTMINIIVTCLVSGYFDLDGEDSWLFNADFWFDETADKYEEFLNKLDSIKRFTIEPSEIYQIIEDYH